MTSDTDTLNHTQLQIDEYYARTHKLPCSGSGIMNLVIGSLTLHDLLEDPEVAAQAAQRSYTRVLDYLRAQGQITGVQHLAYLDVVCTADNIADALSYIVNRRGF